MERQEAIMEMIYNKINEMIGAGSQLFCMQFPAQPLNYRQFQYDTSDRNSSMTKPYAVQEAEFRLSDELFDISPITAGANGEKLSVVYNTLVNNFIPKLEHLAPFIKDRAGLGSFLLGESDEKDQDGKPISRIELCKRLYKEYLDKKNQWNEEKTAKFQAYKLNNDLDGYAKWQSSYGLVRLEELNSHYNNVVVRGHLHEVLTILGYMNASSIAEELELGKQKMRNSARSSIDESMTVYPVQFQPNNWFKALTPNLNPQDLTMAQESIRDQYVAKQRELSRAKAELQQMELLSFNQDEIERIDKRIGEYKQKINKAESQLIGKYGESVVSLAKTYFKATSIAAKISGVVDEDLDKPLVDIALPNTTNDTNATKEQGNSENTNNGSKPGLMKDVARMLGAVDFSDTAMSVLGEGVNGISAISQYQANLNNLLSNLTELRAKKAQLESRDWKFNKASLEQRIKDLCIEVNDYSDLLAKVYQANNTPQQNNASQVNKSSKRIFVTGKIENSKLTYTIKIPTTLTGGTFVLKIGSNSLDPIKVTTLSSEDMRAIQQKLNSIFSITDTDVKYDNNVLTLTISGQSNVLAHDTQEEALEPKPTESTAPLPQGELSILSTPQTEADAEVSGMFTDIVLKISDSKVQASTTQQSSANNSKWSVNTWFTSAAGQSSSSSASTEQQKSFFNQEMEIGFRVAKVSFDRGGWFNPQIFKMSHAFSRLADVRVSPGLSIDDIKNKDQKFLKELTEYKAENERNDKKYKYILPAFPVAMVIAKDITIKVKKTEEISKNAKSVVDNSSSSRGGFLCFSSASASSSKNSSESTFHGAHGEHYYIRIPGPQIIGYFLQLVPQDNSSLYKPNTDENGDSPILKAFEVYNKAKEQAKEVMQDEDDFAE
ncbi:hypothetical protein [Nostoc sp. PA-18-2419]|uniref:hypothetical protein n=1 Tax=Nostoc sp. PA-18-2419 TaxID=2575443 RepID=UPI001108A6ED|nr:hypothetical protein [Nostoc sp. PA-18-2419]